MDVALGRGTIFQELDKPFIMGGCRLMTGSANCDLLLKQVYEASFAMDDVVLYLDTPSG